MDLPFLDTIALLTFICLVLGFEFASERTPLRDKSITQAVHDARRQWMREMSERDVRIFDAQLIGWLSNGNAFFASTSAIAIGGLAALLGASEEIARVLSELPFAVPSTPGLIDLKVLVLIVIMVFAFFKFAWAFRLSHYTVILMGGTPKHDDPDIARRQHHADQVADLLSIVGEHTNQGMRSFYYAIAGLAWFVHPAGLVLATLLVIAILARREYASRSREIIRKSFDASPPGARRPDGTST